MKNLVLVVHGFGDFDKSEQLGAQGRGQIERMAARIKELTRTDKYVMAASCHGEDVHKTNISRESAEVISQAWHHKSFSGYLLDHGLLRAPVDNLSAVDAVRIYRLISGSDNTGNVLVVGNVPLVRDLAYTHLVIDGFVNPSEFRVEPCKFWDKKSEWYISSGGAIWLDYDSKKWQNIGAIPEPKVEAPAQPAVKPESLKLDLKDAFKLVNRDSRRPVLYFVHDTNEAKADSMPLPFVLGMIPGAANEFLEGMGSGRKIGIGGKAYSNDGAHDVEGTVEQGKLELRLIQKRTRETYRRYEGKANPVFYSGEWSGYRGNGAFRAFLDPRNLGFEVLK